MQDLLGLYEQSCFYDVIGDDDESEVAARIDFESAVDNAVELPMCANVDLFPTEEILGDLRATYDCVLKDVSFFSYYDTNHEYAIVPLGKHPEVVFFSRCSEQYVISDEVSIKISDVDIPDGFYVNDVNYEFGVVTAKVIDYVGLDGIRRPYLDTLQLLTSAVEVYCRAYEGQELLKYVTLDLCDYFGRLASRVRASTPFLGKPYIWEVGSMRPFSYLYSLEEKLLSRFYVINFTTQGRYLYGTKHCFSLRMSRDGRLYDCRRKLVPCSVSLPRKVTQGVYACYAGNVGDFKGCQVVYSYSLGAVVSSDFVAHALGNPLTRADLLQVKDVSFDAAVVQLHPWFKCCDMGFSVSEGTRVTARSGRNADRVLSVLLSRKVDELRENDQFFSELMTSNCSVAKSVNLSQVSTKDESKLIGGPKRKNKKRRGRAAKYK